MLAFLDLDYEFDRRTRERVEVCALRGSPRDETWIEKEAETMCQQFEGEHRYLTAMTETREQALDASLRTLLKYFGGPQGVTMQELGRDAYVDLDVRVRVGDLIDAHAALSR